MTSAGDGFPPALGLSGNALRDYDVAVSIIVVITCPSHALHSVFTDIGTCGC